MIKSMTGYGKGSAEKDGLTVTVEIKAVNHRFLDLAVKVPKSLSAAEDAVRKALKARLARGHADVFVSYEDNREDRVEVSVDYALAAQLSEAARNLALTTGEQDTFGIAELMRTPEVVKFSVREEDEEVARELAEQAAAAAAAALDERRREEGANLRADLLAKLDALRACVALVAENGDAMVAEHREKLRARIAEYLGEVQLDEARLLNETAFYADKVCVDEELTRLSSHLTRFADILERGGAVGKDLDFLVQEMNRETNTIGSKCCNLTVTGAVLDMKSLIEKIREQIQNIE